MTADLREVSVAPAQERVDRLNAEMLDVAARIRDHMGLAFGGFVTVAWDMRGACYTVISAEEGPIATGFAPQFAEQALNRHVAVKLAEEQQTETLGGA